MAVPQKPKRTLDRPQMVSREGLARTAVQTQPGPGTSNQPACHTGLAQLTKPFYGDSG